MQILNKDIYKAGEGFDLYFEDFNEYMPAKLSFYFLQNKKKLIYAYADLYKIRKNMIKKYASSFDEKTGNYSMDERNVIIANKEFEELLNESQNLDFHLLSIDDFKDIKFTPNQLDTIMFMLKENYLDLKEGKEDGSSNTVTENL